MMCIEQTRGTVDWFNNPLVKAAYDNGKDFTGVNLNNIRFVSEQANEKFTLFDLSDANFRGCDLSSTVFFGAYICGADFTGANLEGCEFISCCIGGDGPRIMTAENIRMDVMHENYLGGYVNLYTIRNIRMPLDTTGKELIGYKALAKSFFMRKDELAIAKLLIPSDARRVVFKGDKCRCDKVKVLDIYSPDKKFYYDSAHSFVYPDHVVYKRYHEVCADSFEPLEHITCAHGIHFFLTEEEAIKFGKSCVRFLNKR